MPAWEEEPLKTQEERYHNEGAARSQGLEQGPRHAANAEMQVYGTEFRHGRQTEPGWHHALKQES